MPSTAQVGFQGHPLTLWMSGNYAQLWLADAEREAATGDMAAKRRAVVFAVCAAESYVVEWTRNTVLHGNVEALLRYFPEGEELRVYEKFREIPKRLARDKQIPATLDCGGPEYQALRDLVEVRNYLVHGGPSLPTAEGKVLGRDDAPVMSDLSEMPPAWPIAVVRTLFEKLHADTATPPPEWL